MLNISLYIVLAIGGSSTISLSVVEVSINGVSFEAISVSNLLLAGDILLFFISSFFTII